MSLPYYKIFPAVLVGNYQIQTMPYDMQGIFYQLCIVQLWLHEGQIPDNPSYLAPLLKLSESQWDIIRQEFLDRGLIQIIDGCVTDAALREKWVRARNYSDEQSAKRLAAIQAKKERDLLKKDNKNR